LKEKFQDYKHGTENLKNSVVPKIEYGYEELVMVPHGRSIFLMDQRKPIYLEHTNSNFESEKCMTNPRLRTMH